MPMEMVVVKRSLSPGFAGIPNPLFAADNTLMLFEDGKKAVVDIVAAMKEAAAICVYTNDRIVLEEL